MKAVLPSEMQAIILSEKGASPEVRHIPIPQPGPGEVLIKMHASPINPSDLAFLEGNYGLKKPYPVVPGLEGSGAVVEAGSGILPKLWMGKNVACAAHPKYNGCWAEYMTTSAAMCVPLNKQVSLDQGASMFVNPLTALAFFDIHQKMQRSSKQKIGIINTAAAGALGRMILKLGISQGIPILCIVRRAEQLELLKKEGAVHILNSSEPDFDQQLKDLAHELHTTLVLDAIGGQLTKRLIYGAPRKSTILIYGRLSPDACEIDPGHMIFTGSNVKGFWLSEWLKSKNTIRSMLITRKVQSLISGELSTSINQIFPLNQINEALETYTSNMSKGKVLLKP